MKNLVVRPPSGPLQLVKVGEGGGYFDPARVLHDERVDGPISNPEPPAHSAGEVATIASIARGVIVWEIAAAPVSVPAEVTMRQARLALLGAGKLAAVDAAIDALPDPQKAAARIEWDYSSTVRRQQPLVLALAPALGLSTGQLDALFIAAAAL